MVLAELETDSREMLAVVVAGVAGLTAMAVKEPPIQAEVEGAVKVEAVSAWAARAARAS